MNKKTKIAIIIILVIVVILAIVKFNKKEEPKNDNESNTVNNIVNEINENVVNEVEETNITNTPVTNKDYTSAINEIPMEQQLPTQKKEDNIYEQDNDIGTTDKKQQAINLVKQSWGNDDTVTFSCDSITSDGKYIIAVSSKTQARVLNYYKVDLNTKSVEVDY